MQAGREAGWESLAQGLELEFHVLPLIADSTEEVAGKQSVNSVGPGLTA